MPEDTPKMAVFEPPIELFVAKAGEVVSCTADGSFEHQGELQGVKIPDLGTLIEFVMAVNEGQVRCVCRYNGQVIGFPPWLAFHLEALEKQGRLKLVDMPEAGESGTVTEVGGG
ncbi:MAG: hypothetical protein ACYTFI_00830 [Planctomycetota bacterium]|jgi:hypothetical protein